MTTTTPRDLAQEQDNKDQLQAAFDRWTAGTGSPFELLAEDATWTIVGNSPVARTYHGRGEFIGLVIEPFNARLSEALVPRVRGLFADGDWVVALFEAHATARDGLPYDNTYTWYLRFDAPRRVVEVIAFFDAVEFTELWERVAPA